MAELRHFTNKTLPEGYAHQHRSYIRIKWYDVYTDYPDAQVLDVDVSEINYFMVVQGHALLSSATIVRREIDAGGVPYICYGMSGVFTYPAFRKKGYAQEVVSAASAYMREQADADVALLWTDPALGDFYGKNGWEVMEGLTLWLGDPDDPRHDDDSFLMMMFISDRAKENREAIINSRIYVGKHSW